MKTLIAIEQVQLLTPWTDIQIKFMFCTNHNTNNFLWANYKVKTGEIEVPESINTADMEH